MHIFILVGVLVIGASLARAELVVIKESGKPTDTGTYRVVEIAPFPKWTGLKEFTQAFGVRVGVFPSLVDTQTKLFVPIETTLAAAESRLTAVSQAVKTPERKSAEKKYYQLVKAVLTEANDPRKNITPIPKLGIDELADMLDAMYATNTKDKVIVRLSLQLLSLDAYLKRYSPTWWDSVIDHAE